MINSKENTISSNKISVRNLNLSYGEKQALFNINMDISAQDITALIGPSGCGKSTFLRCINRMNDTIENCRIDGEIIVDGVNILDKSLDVVELRTKIGMVFQKPNPFPKSIYDNVAYGPRIHGLCRNKKELDELVKESLHNSGLYEEVKDRLQESGTSLSGGQQQRLCIARTIAVRPQIILMDEPCSALDPIATSKIEQMIVKLAENYTIVMVTHSMQQASRISSYTAFFHMGYLIEQGMTKDVFENPKLEKTRDYISGRIG